MRKFNFIFLLTDGLHICKSWRDANVFLRRKIVVSGGISANIPPMGKVTLESMVPVYRDGLNVQEIEYQWFFGVAAREWAMEKGGEAKKLFEDVVNMSTDRRGMLKKTEIDTFDALVRMYLTDQNWDGLHVIFYE